MFTLHFRDDQVICISNIFADDEDDIHYMLTKLDEQYEKWGLTINTTKRQCIVVKHTDLQLSKGVVQRLIPIKIWQPKLLPKSGKQQNRFKKS